MVDQTMTWHDDGHYLSLRISKAELNISEIYCPHEDGQGKCYDEVFGCLVKQFVERFGLDCNAGTCPATDKMDICWTIIGDRRVVEECQLWFMPKTDEVFSAWLTSKLNNQKSSD